MNPRHTPRKRFGQNFLQDSSVIERIIQSIHPKPDDNMVEIGPGLGAMTLPLLKSLHALHVVEIDRDLQAHLKTVPGREKLTIHGQDALTYNFSTLGPNLRVVGNLPYNISTPLLIHLLGHISTISDMHFMLQKEVVLRLCATPHQKAYGRLSVMVQLFCQTEHLFDVPPNAFYPPPKVDSAIIRLIPHPKGHYPTVNLDLFSNVVMQAFGMRRKTIANNLKPYLNAAELESLHIAPTARPENLSVSDYIKITQYMDKA